MDKLVLYPSREVWVRLTDGGGMEGLTGLGGTRVLNEFRIYAKTGTFSYSVIGAIGLFKKKNNKTHKFSNSLEQLSQKPLEKVSILHTH